MSGMDERFDLNFAVWSDGAHQAWGAPPNALETPFENVHLWRFALRASADELTSFAAKLVEEERTRADRFARSVDRDRYLVGRGTLRVILSWYLTVAPEAIRFCYGTHGKPALANQSSLQFNLSHSDDFALLAVRWDRPLGVDVEQIAASDHHAAIAAEVFSAEDARRVAAASTEERPALFLKLWTRREAMLKATGVGLAGSTTPLDADLHSFTPADGFIASIALL